LRDEPRPRAKDGSIELSIVIIIRRRWDIAVLAKRKCKEGIILASQNEPFSGRRPEESEIALAVTGEIARRYDIG
jgi:hypothetical protein